MGQDTPNSKVKGHFPTWRPQETLETKEAHTFIFFFFFYEKKKGSDSPIHTFNVDGEMLRLCYSVMVGSLPAAKMQ